MGRETDNRQGRRRSNAGRALLTKPGTVASRPSRVVARPQRTPCDYGDPSKRTIDMTGRPLEEIALELIQLRGRRPMVSHTKGTDEWREKMDAYYDHMHKEYLLEQEMYRRTGIDRTNDLLKQMRQVLTICIPT